MSSTVPGSDLESIPCMENSFTKSEQCLVGDPHDARVVAQGPRDQESCVCRVSCGKTRCWCLFLSLHTYPSSCLLLCHLVVRIDPVMISPGCIVDLIVISRRVYDRATLQYQNLERTISNPIHKYDEQ